MARTKNRKFSIFYANAPVAPCMQQIYVSSTQPLTELSPAFVVLANPDSNPWVNLTHPSDGFESDEIV